MAAESAPLRRGAGLACRRIGQDGRQEISRTLAREHRARQPATFGRGRGRTRDGGCRAKGDRGSQEHGASSGLEGGKGSRGGENSGRCPIDDEEEAQRGVFEIKRTLEFGFGWVVRFGK